MKLPVSALLPGTQRGPRCPHPGFQQWAASKVCSCLTTSSSEIQCALPTVLRTPSSARRPPANLSEPQALAKGRWARELHPSRLQEAPALGIQPSVYLVAKRLFKGHGKTFQLASDVETSLLELALTTQLCSPSVSALPPASHTYSEVQGHSEANAFSQPSPPLTAAPQPPLHSSCHRISGNLCGLPGVVRGPSEMLS